MKKNIIFYLCLALATSSILPSCVKDDIAELGGAGTPRVKILEAPSRALFFSPFNDVRRIDMFSIRRDETTSAGIDKSVSIKVKAVPDSVKAYNNANGTTYEKLPDSIYSLADNGVKRDGQVFTITISSKSIGNELTILMDGSKWDVTHKYAMYYRIVDAAGLEPVTNVDHIFVTIEAKNKWDGIYEVEGSQSDVYSPTLGNINLFLTSPENTFGIEPPMQYELRTISPTQCVAYDNYFFGGYYKPISVKNDDGTFAYSYYGDFCPVFEFDPVTNEIVSVTNYYGQPAPSNTRSAEIDPSGENVYDESSRSFSIKYWMLQPLSIPDPPHIRVSFDEKWTYIGERE